MGGSLGVAVAVPPAAAETELTVEAGYGGNFVAGRSLPVRVVVESDRLIRGTLQVGIKVPGDDLPPLSTPIEVSGGSNKTVTVVLATPVGHDKVEVDVAIQGEQLAGETEARYTGDTDLVGLLPDVAARTPEPVTFAGDLGQAVFAELDSGLLATPGALDPLGTIVAPAEGLQALNERSRQNLLGWLEQGGRLVVDAAPGGEVVGLPDEWQPGAAATVAAGRGQVVLADGAVAAGRWADVVVPTAATAPGDFGMSWWSMEDVATSVGRDGGLRVPSVGWLALFLAGYVILVGPVVFFVLRRMRRTSWTWMAVAGFAVVFAAGAFVVGADLRSGNKASHGTIVHTGPAGATGFSYVGLVSRSGEDGRAVFPEGWRAASLSSNLGGFDDVGFPGQEVFSLDPARVSLSPAETVGEVDLDPGGVGMVMGWGPLEETPGLEVTATAHPDGTLSGVLRNTTDETLREVLVVVDGWAWGGGRLGPGEETDWRIEPADDGWQDGPPEEPWEDAIGWDTGDVPDDTPVNYAMWEEMTARYVDPYPSGVVVAAGWTQRYVPPVDVGGTIEAGRTVFTTEAPIQAEPGGAPPEAVRREILRTARTVEVDNDRFEEIENNWGGVSGVVMRFTLPAGVAGVPLRASLPSHVLGAEVWDGQAWVPLVRIDRRGEVVDESEAQDGNFDPWGEPPTTADLGPEHVHGGTVMLRLQTIDMGGGVPLPTVGQAA